MRSLRTPSWLGLLPWALAALLGAPRVSAQDAVTFEDAQRYATDHAPEVMLSVARSEVARAEAGMAGQVAPNPRINLGTTEHGARATAGFYAFLPFFGRHQAAIRAADAQAMVLAEDVDVARLDARLATAQAWIELWLVEREAALAEESATRWERLSAMAVERVGAGAGSRLDSMRSRAEALRARSEAAATVERASGARARLAIWLGRDPTAELRTDGPLPLAGEVPALESLLDELEAHPLLARSGAQEHAAAALVHAQRRSRWPIFGVQASAQIAPRNGGPTELSGGILLDLPVFSGPGLPAAHARERMARAEGELERQRLAAEIVDAHGRCRAALRLARTQEDDVLPAAHDVAELALEAYGEGSLDMNAVISAQQSYLDTQLATRRAEADFALALTSLAHAVGRR